MKKTNLYLEKTLFLDLFLLFFGILVQIWYENLQKSDTKPNLISFMEKEGIVWKEK
jgi:hypothetical protein